MYYLLLSIRRLMIAVTVNEQLLSTSSGAGDPVALYGDGGPHLTSTSGFVCANQAGKKFHPGPLPFVGTGQAFVEETSQRLSVVILKHRKCKGMIKRKPLMVSHLFLRQWVLVMGDQF